MAGASASELAPRFEDGGLLRIAGLSGRFGPANRGEIPALWSRFGPHYFGKIPGQIGMASYGVCDVMDEAGNLDYLAGVEVASFDGLEEALTKKAIVPHRYAVFAHADHISKINELWMAIFDRWLPQSGFVRAATPAYEYYDADFDPRVAIGHVEIWIPIQREDKVG